MKNGKPRATAIGFPSFVVRLLLIGTGSSSVLLASAAAQHAAHAVPAVPKELIERVITIRTGIGTSHDDAAARSAEAQKFYDQGQALLHNYVWIDAARSFHQALRLDPSLALAQVGLSYAYIELNQPLQAREAITRAQALADKSPEHVKRHVNARLLQMAAEDAPRDTAKLAAYRKSLDEAIAAFPNDTEFLLHRGIAESPDPADRGQGSVNSSIPYYERTLKLSAPSAFAQGATADKSAALGPKGRSAPSGALESKGPSAPSAALGSKGTSASSVAQGSSAAPFAAHHFLAHAYENAGRIKEAEAEAALYASLAPSVPHAVHMHGHELRRLGRIADAIARFEAADRLERDYISREKIPAEFDWHFAHNLDLLAASYQYTGQMKKAETLLKESFNLPTNLLVQAVNKREWPAFLLARNRPSDALAAAQTLVSHPSLVVQATGHIESGFAYLAMNRPAEAANSSNLALRALRAAQGGQDLAAIALEALQGEFLLRTAQRDKGPAVMERAAQKWRALPGPDAWTQSLFRLEAQARAARAVGDWPFAARMAQLMLEHDANYAGTHLALALVAQHDGNTPTARREAELALKSWALADKGLVEMQMISDLRR